MSVSDIVDNGSVTLSESVRIAIPINVFIASFLPNIFTEKSKSGVLIVNNMLDTGNPVSFDITTDKPLRPPGAIVFGTKNIFNPTAIIIQAIINPMYCIKISLFFFMI